MTSKIGLFLGGFDANKGPWQFPHPPKSEK